MAVALVVGGWFASKAVSILCDSITSFITDRYQGDADVKSRLQRIEGNLRKIEGVIGAVERGITEDPAVVSWLNDLKDGVYDAEDILDFFNYESLCCSVESSGSKSEGRSSNLVNLLRKFVKKAKIGATRAFSHSLYDLFDIVNKFDRLSNDALIGTFLKVIEMNTDSKKEDGSFNRRQTSPVLAEAKVFGRSIDMDKLRDKIFDKNGSNGEKFSVVSIVGIGGVGKTTLAQWLYNREDVKNHFNLQAWVCTPGKSDMGTVMMKIIENASKRPYNRINFATIHEDLLRRLREKRFLIVLDDVCDEIIDQWDKLIIVFRRGKEGSKIIITTRNRNVADKVNSVDRIYLEGIEDKEYWEFFRCCAFGNVNPKDHPKLEHIGQQIVTKLGGLPLAAKAVGGVLKERLEERHWRDVLENKEWKKEGKILPSLRLSYNLLPPYLKQCFVYCALFPKHYLFDKDKLVHIWVAQGFVQSSDETKTLEDIGRKYFDELYSRSLFQYDAYNYYVIHDLLHDLAELIFADEIYKEENTSSVELNIPMRVRHLFISSTNLGRVLGQIEEPKQLRSLVYDPPFTSNISQISRSDFKKLRGLRVLILGKHCSSSHLLETIGNMIHLRYLECPFGTKLPISLGRLYNLQVLEISSSRLIRDEYLPLDEPDDWFSLLSKEVKIDNDQLIHCFNDQTTMSKIFGKLTNLRYINAPRSLISAIPSIGRLTSLQRLPHYEVREHEGYRICELRNLNKIRGCLRIVNLENVSKEKAKKAELHNKVHLEALSLWWNKLDNCSNDEVREQEEVLEWLQPHSNIKVIGISRYMGLKHPSWLNKSNLSNIECISLFACGCLKALPPLGEFPFLKYLSLDSLTSLEKIGGGGVFQSLLHLELEDLEELRELSSIKENVGDMMPHLSRLKITRCNKLEALPPLGGLQCLEHLILKQLDSLTKIETKASGRESTVLPKLDYLELSSIKGLNEWLAPNNGHSLMPNVTRLLIINCPNLKVIPPLGVLPSLKDLNLAGLDLLEEIGIEIYGCEKSAFPSLKSLSLVDLKELKKWLGFKEDIGGMMPCLSRLEISRCNKLEAIPPLGGLQCLKYLILDQLDSLTKIETKTSGRESTVLPKLNYLNLSSMKELKEWLAPDDGQSLMPHLATLYIINCLNLKVTPPLGELPSLEDLRLEGLDLLEEIDIEIYGREIAFPSLRHLKLSDLKELKKWYSMMPHLSWLEITRCNKLEALPPLGGFYAQPSITIKDCSNLKLIPLKELPYFKLLDLERLDSLETVQLIPLKEFPSFKRVNLESLDSLEEILLELRRRDSGEVIDIPVEEQGRDLMPHLQRLRIIDCHKLRRPTHFTSSLEDLTFGFSKIVAGMQMFHELFPVGTLTRLESLSLGPLIGLDFFTGAQQGWLQSLSSLGELRFNNCSDLRSLPDVLESLCHLEWLTLIDCPEMVSLGKNNLPKNLEGMQIIRCGELGKLCDWRQDGREWSKICHIPQIVIDIGDDGGPSTHEGPRPSSRACKLPARFQCSDC